MCGIAGIINFQGKPNTRHLDLMLKSLKHRGPDGEGKWHDSHVALGMRRLSIIDISGGMQPLFNEDKSIVIVGNGEIYNYKKLNQLIKRKGHTPRTGSDIETIIHLYEEYGLECVNKLEGMFSFSLYDQKKQVALLARDRMGEKPLYYSSNKNSIYFSSELKSIIHVVPHKNIDLDAVNLYFHYYFVPEPKTLFPHIHKLPAGHTCLIDINSKNIQVNKYWNPKKIKANNHKDPTQIIKKLFTQATKSTLVSDVDVAVSLSGGLDSSAILATAAKLYSKKMKAFTVGYEGNISGDERALAKIIADKYGVDHVQTELKAKDVVSHFPRLVYDGDDPIADIAGHGIYSVAKLAREHGIKVLLGGLGGDELFWGYPWMRRTTRANYLSRSKFNFYNRITPFKNAEQFINKLTTSTFNENINPDLPFSIFQPKTKPKSKLANARLSQDLIRDFWLISNCITYNDRLSMSVSVELRSPILNHILVESSYQLKKNVLGYELEDGKHYFKKAIKELLPLKIYNAPKRGFQPPVARWLYYLIRRYLPLLNDGYLVSQRILSSTKIKNISRFWLFQPNRWIAIYQLLVLEIWCREYILNQAPKSLAYDQ